MMRASLIAAGIALGSFAAPANAQVQFEFGIDRPGYDGPRYRDHRGDWDRRQFRGPVVRDDDDDDCRIVIRRRVNRYGEMVERRTRVCD